MRTVISSRTKETRWREKSSNLKEDEWGRGRERVEPVQGIEGRHEKDKITRKTRGAGLGWLLVVLQRVRKRFGGWRKRGSLP